MFRVSLLLIWIFSIAPFVAEAGSCHSARIGEPDTSDYIDNDNFVFLPNGCATVPLNKFIYFVYETDRRGLQQVTTKRDLLNDSGGMAPRLSLGYAVSSDNSELSSHQGMRRTTSALPGHTTLMAHAVGFRTVNEFIREAASNRANSGNWSRGRHGGGGFVVTEHSVIINPLYSFKSGGVLEDSLLDVFVQENPSFSDVLSPNMFHEYNLATMNAELWGHLGVKNIFGYGDQYLLPVPLWQDVLNEIVRAVGKPIVWDPHLPSEHFKWNYKKRAGRAPNQGDIGDFNRIINIMESADIHSMILRANQSLLMPSSSPSGY
jgi:hypothetical protein